MDYSITVGTITVFSDGYIHPVLFLEDDKLIEGDESIVLALEVIGDPVVEILTPKMTLIITDDDGKY